MRAWAWLAVLSRAFFLFYILASSFCSKWYNYFFSSTSISILFCSCFVYLPAYLCGYLAAYVCSVIGFAVLLFQFVFQAWGPPGWMSASYQAIYTSLYLDPLLVSLALSCSPFNSSPPRGLSVSCLLAGPMSRDEVSQPAGGHILDGGGCF